MGRKRVGGVCSRACSARPPTDGAMVCSTIRSTDNPRMAATTSDIGPWRLRLARPTDSASFIVLRPSISTSYNSGFAWGMSDGPVWQGRGVNAWATAGFAWHLGILSARIEPLFDYAQNRSFGLAPTPSTASPFVDDMRPTIIDLPQRFGARRFTSSTPVSRLCASTIVARPSGFRLRTFSGDPACVRRCSLTRTPRASRTFSRARVMASERQSDGS